MNKYVMPVIPDTFKKYECPYCKEIHYDRNERLFDNIIQYNINFTILKCRFCGNKYGLYYDYKNNIITFINPSQFHREKCNIDYFTQFIKKFQDDSLNIDILFE